MQNNAVALMSGKRLYDESFLISASVQEVIAARATSAVCPASISDLTDSKTVLIDWMTTFLGKVQSH